MGYTRVKMVLLRRHRRTLWLIVTAVLLVGCVSLYWQNEIPAPGHTEMKNERTYKDHNTRQENDEIKSLTPDLGENAILSTIPRKRTPKVYVYSLPNKFNLDIINCNAPRKVWCINLKNGGFGDLLYNVGELAVYSTNQFSLEVILHNQFLLSKYRTDRHEEADIFYIPAYMGIGFFCGYSQTMNITNIITEMFSVVNTLPYFSQGRPHISTMSMIEREMGHWMYPVATHPMYRNVTYFIIEKEAKASIRKFMGLENRRAVVVPYPSYVHFDRKLAMSQAISSPSLESRVVFMFLASSDRRTNPFRNSIVDQIPNGVGDIRFSDYITANITDSGPRQVWLKTRECLKTHENITIEWMQNSVFCLQPHGDSPTRKSFYDSVVSGCIPVIFKFNFEHVEYPFQRVLNYSDFVVIIDSSRVVDNRELVVNILKEIPQSEIVRLHTNVLRVARQLQYSSSIENHDSPYIDALDMIMDEVKNIYNL